MATRLISNLTNLGSMELGDKVVGERVDGTTVRLTYAPKTVVGTTDRVTITGGGLDSSTIDIASTYAGQTTIITLGTLTTGTWRASLVELAYGGTGANLTASNGGIVYSTASAMAILSGTATANKMLLSGSSDAPTWSTSTIPTSAGATALKHLRSDGTNYILTTATYSDTPSTAGKVMVSDGTNWITSTPTFPNASATSLKYIKSDGTNWVASSTTYPDTGTLNKFLVGDGTNYVESTSTIPTSAGATANKVLLSDGTNYALSTPTFPNASATTRKIVVSDGTNWIASTETYAVPGASGKVMQSDGTNWTSATPTGSGAPVLNTTPTLVTPVLGAATATSITFSPTTGGIVGTTTNNNADAGKVGEVISSTVSGVAITTAVATNVTSISLTAGDWDIEASVYTTPAGTTTQAYRTVGINTVSATIPTVFTQGGARVAGTSSGGSAPPVRQSLAGTTTVYLVATVSYAISTLTISGTIKARRAR